MRIAILMLVTIRAMSQTVPFLSDPSYTRDDYSWWKSNNGSASTLYRNGVYQSQEGSGGNYSVDLAPAQAFQATGCPVGLVDSGVNFVPVLDGATINTRSGITNEGVWSDYSGHGTFTAGIVTQICNATLLAVQSRLSDPNDWPPAIHWLAEHGAKVINFPIGSSSPSAGLLTAIQSHPNVLFVCALPDVDQNIDTTPDYPASWHLPNVIAVGGLDRLGNLYVTGRGSNIVYAPSRIIISTHWQTGQPCYNSGTSQASAIVTGCAALVRQRYPLATAEEIAFRFRLVRNFSALDGFRPWLEMSNQVVSVRAYTGQSCAMLSSSNLNQWTVVDHFVGSTNMVVGEGFYRVRAE